MKLPTLVKQLEKHRDRIAKERDALRDFVSDAESLLETVERAHEDIQCAIESLSEQS